MKNTLILITALILSFSCSQVEYVDQWDHITLKVNNSTNPTYLSNTEIVEQATLIQNYNEKHNTPGSNTGTYNIIDSNRKPATNEFQLPGTFVYNTDGTLNYKYLNSTNILLVRSIYSSIQTGDSRLNPGLTMVLDTIAFIPSSNISTAKNEMELAVIEKRALDCYYIFQEMMVFTPTTGNEFKKLKNQNLN